MHPRTPTRPIARHLVRIIVLAMLAVTLGVLVPGGSASAHTGHDRILRARRSGTTLVVAGRDFPRNTWGKVRLSTPTGRGNRELTLRTNRYGNFVKRFNLGAGRSGSLTLRARVGGHRKGIRLYVAPLSAAAKPTRTTTKTPTTTTPTTTTPTTTTPTTTTPTTLPAAGLTGPVGPDAAFAPLGDVQVALGQLTPELLYAKPDGTRFVIAPGIHRIPASLRPKSGQQLLGMPGAVISGSKVLSTWRQEGAYWVADNQTQRLPAMPDPANQCMDGWETCVLSEDLFLDHAPLRQVSSLSQLSAGRFYFDYTNSRIYLADNPAGRLVETTVLDAAFNGGGSNVVIRNLRIEKFGSLGNTGAVRTGGSSGWLIERNDIRLNHGQGVATFDNAIVRGNTVRNNGQQGLAGKGRNMLIENNEIAHNNMAGFKQGWSGSGAKWYKTDGLITRHNWVHHNYGHGLWTDINNINTTHEYNLAEDNGRAGIYHEISYSAVIRHNVIRRSYTGWTTLHWPDGGGIKVEASPNVEVYGNVLQNNPKGVVLVAIPRTEEALYGAHDMSNVFVHDNDIAMTTPYSGLSTYNIADPTPYFTTKGIRFDRNTYRLSGAAATAGFQWMGRNVNATTWKSYGNDVNGTFLYQ